MDFWKEDTELVTIPFRTADGVDHIITLPDDYWRMLHKIDRSDFISVTEVIDVAWNAVLLDREAGHETKFSEAMAYAIQVFHQRFENDRLGLTNDNVPETLERLPLRS